MFDPETRKKVEKTRNRRLFREALAKRKLLSNESIESLEKAQLPSFAEIIDKQNGIIKCKICFEETHFLKFKKHLQGMRHQTKIEELKKQVKLSEKNEAELIKNIIDEDNFEDETTLMLGKRFQNPDENIQDPLEGAKSMEIEEDEDLQAQKFIEKNKLDLPSGFFDDESERKKFEDEEKKRIARLSKKVGIEEIGIKGVSKESRLEFMKFQEEIAKIENREENGEIENNVKEGGLGRELIQNDADFLVDRVSKRLEKLKKMREMKRNKN